MTSQIAKLVLGVCAQLWTPNMPPAALPQTVTTNSTVLLVTVSAPQAQLGRGRHIAMAGSSAGDVVGHILNAKGGTICRFDGSFDGACLYFYGCGARGEAYCL